MKANTHAKAIDEKTLEDIMSRLDSLLKDVEPYVTPLTPQERMTLPKMGDKTLAFVEKSFDFAKANPDLVPNYLNLDEFEIDLKDAHGLYAAVNKAAQLLQNLSDTQMCAGSEAFQCSLVFYNSAKIGAANNVTGAKAVYEELRKRFPNRSRRKPACEAGTPSSTDE